MRKYRPSNGSEGCGFIETYCMNCINEKFMHTNDHADKKCDILSRTMIHDVRDKEYPEEWTYDEKGSPVCTEFKKWDWGNNDDDNGLNEPPHPPIDDPNQLCFPFIFDELSIPKLNDMKIKIKETKEVEVKTLHVEAGVRYWEDATVNGVEDTEGNLIPCREVETWKPIIELETGQIINWNKGTKADIHYKVCDAGSYFLKDANGKTIAEKDGYVPKILCPGEDGFGDYIILEVDENGMIQKWNPDLKDFLDQED